MYTLRIKWNRLIASIVIFMLPFGHMALAAPPFVPTESGSFVKIDDLTCAEFFSDDEDDTFTTAVVSIWLNGYMSGLERKPIEYNDVFIWELMEYMATRCEEGPSVKIINFLMEYSNERVNILMETKSTSE